jgi:hypothetical protein
MVVYDSVIAMGKHTTTGIRLYKTALSARHNDNGHNDDGSAIAKYAKA